MSHETDDQQAYTEWEQAHINIMGHPPRMSAEEIGANPVDDLVALAKGLLEIEIALNAALVIDRKTQMALDSMTGIFTRAEWVLAKYAPEES